MKLLTLRDQFARMGARVMVEPARELFRAADAVRLDVRSDHRGEYFHFLVDPLRVVALEVIEVRPRDGYLMLSTRQRLFGQMREAPRRIMVCGMMNQSLFVRDVSNHPVRSSGRPKAAPAKKAARSITAQRRHVVGHQRDAARHRPDAGDRSRPNENTSPSRP